MSFSSSTLSGMNSLPDGSFPIRHAADLNAALAHPDAESARAHIIVRAAMLSLTDLLPVDWKQEDTMTSTAETFFPIYSTTSNGLTASSVTITVDETADEDLMKKKKKMPEGEMPMADGPAWRALLAVEGVPTEDGRLLAEGSLTWRDLPLSLMALDNTGPGGHEGAIVAGRIDNIWRDGNEVWGEGVFNGDEFGMHIAELVGNQSLRGNSIDPAVTKYEYRDAETGEVLDGDALMDAMMSERPILTVFLEAIIMASTVCSTPAIGEANIVLASGLLRTVWFQAQPEDAVLTASGAGMAPLHPPAAWFENPGFRELTPLTVTDDGRVMGHAAGWNTCHVGEPHGAGVCVTPPRSGMGYEVFHHGAVQTAEGHDVSVGHITMSTSHAGPGLGWKAAQDHYDNSGAVVADVRAGEDRFGIWVSGALRPDLPAARVREMKAGSISGDWRSVIGRGLEFISALIVNIPGFPVPRPQASITASAAGLDEVESLVAAGIVECDCVDDMSRREYLRKIRMLTD